jgi:L-alanine-DL-glutamate epimerase-like enolase superfamily enzyme
MSVKITDLKCAILGENPVIRIATDEGIDGYGQIESTKPYTTPHVLFFRDALLGEDPTNVERVMLKIRQRGSFKPWGSAVSAIEIALWDLAGKAAGVPVYKLLGGKVRDRVRIYNGGLRFPIESYTPEEYAESTRKMLASSEGFTIIKQPIGFHSQMKRVLPDFFYGDARSVGMHGALDRGALTERGLKHLIACVEAMKAVTGDAVGLALDCGPGFFPSDALRFARAMEPSTPMWLEDISTAA